MSARRTSENLRRSRHVLSLLPMDDRCCDCGRRLRAISGEKPRYCSRCGIVDEDDSEPVALILEKWRRSKTRPGDGGFLDRADEELYAALQLMVNRLRVVEAELAQTRQDVGVLEYHARVRNP